MNELILWLLDLVQSVPPDIRTLIAGLGILLETSVLIGLVVPGDTIVIIASTAVQGVAEGVALVIAVIVGALIGESIGFGIGRFFGPRIRASRLGQRLGENNWARAERFVRRRGGVAVFVSRFLPVLHSVIPLTAGMTTMRYRTFLAWTLPATTIWTLGYVSVGVFAAGTFRQLLDTVHFAGYLFVAIILVFLLLTYLVKRVLQRAVGGDDTGADASAPAPD